MTFFSSGRTSQAAAVLAGTLLLGVGLGAPSRAQTPSFRVVDSLRTAGQFQAALARLAELPQSQARSVDVAAARNAEDDLYPQLAPVAIQQGRHAARQVCRGLNDRPLEPFDYRDLGKMATLGRNAGIAELVGGIKLKGVLAWLIWASVHVAQAPGPPQPDDRLHELAL